MVRDLDVAARKLPNERPCVLQLDGHEVRFAGEVLLSETDAQPLFRTLASAGASGMLIAPPLTGVELLGFVELVLAVGTGFGPGDSKDVVERLRTANLPGIALIFTPIEGSENHTSASRLAKTGLATRGACSLDANDARLVRSCLERDFGRSMALAAASALVEGCDDGRLGANPQELAPMLATLLTSVLHQHEVHVAIALLEETDRCRSLDSQSRLLLGNLLEATVDDTWVTAVTESLSHAQACALGVLLLRCAQLLPVVLRCEAALRDETLAHELELIARLNPEPFALSVDSEDRRERDAALAILRRAGHRFAGGPDASISPQH